MESINVQGDSKRTRVVLVCEQVDTAQRYGLEQLQKKQKQKRRSSLGIYPDARRFLTRQEEEEEAEEFLGGVYWES